MLNVIITGTKEGFAIYFAQVKGLHSKLECDVFGIRFGLYIHFEMKLTLAKIQNLVEADPTVARSTTVGLIATRSGRGLPTPST